jgi:hypothetical protein
MIKGSSRAKVGKILSPTNLAKEKKEQSQIYFNMKKYNQLPDLRNNSISILQV